MSTSEFDQSKSQWESLKIIHTKPEPDRFSRGRIWEDLPGSATNDVAWCVHLTSRRSHGISTPPPRSHRPVLSCSCVVRHKIHLLVARSDPSATPVFLLGSSVALLTHRTIRSGHIAKPPVTGYRHAHNDPTVVTVRARSRRIRPPRLVGEPVHDGYTWFSRYAGSASIAGRSNVTWRC